MKRGPQHSDERAAFTLLEVMLSSVLMAIIVGMVLSITTTVLNGWKRASDGASLEIQSRAALDYVATSLGSAVGSDDGRTWMFLEVEENSGRIDERMTLRYLSRPQTTTQDNSGLPVATALWSDQSTGQGAAPGLRSLAFSSMSPVDTTNAVLANTNSLDALEALPISDFYGGGSGLLNAYLLPHCVSLSFVAWAWSADGAELFSINDAVGGLSTGDVLSFPGDYTDANGTTVHVVLPARIDIVLRIVGQESARDYDHLSVTGDSEIEWFEQNSHVFVRSVFLAGADGR